MCESECVRETEGKIKRQIRASANDTNANNWCIEV